MRSPLEWRQDKMRAIFSDLLPDSWDSPEYAATEEPPRLSEIDAAYYQRYPEVRRLITAS